MATNRSPNYPAVSLPEAVELVGKVYSRERQSPVDQVRAALALGYSSLSGPARTKLSALRKYGLLDDTATGLRVSDRAMTILKPFSDEERVAALRDAALEPPLFRELASYPGASDENLAYRLVRAGFTEAGAKLAVASYRETTSLVPTEASEYTEPMMDASARHEVTPEPRRYGPGLSGLNQNIGVTLRGGVRAELRFPPGDMTPEVVETLRKFLDWTEALRADPEAQDPGAAKPSESDPSGLLLLPERSQPGARD